VIYLRMPAEVSADLTKQKGERTYLGDKKDIQEEDHSYRTMTHDMYTTLAERSDHWMIIDCMKNGTIRSKEDIHKEVINILQQKDILAG